VQVAAQQERLDVAERQLSKRDADVSRLRHDTARLESEADEARSSLRHVQAQVRSQDDDKRQVVLAQHANAAQLRRAWDRIDEAADRLPKLLTTIVACIPSNLRQLQILASTPMSQPRGGGGGGTMDVVEAEVEVRCRQLQDEVAELHAVSANVQQASDRSLAECRLHAQYAKQVI